MVTFHPIFVLLAVLVLLTGAVIHIVRKSSILKGYSDVAGDAERLQRALKGETFRDGSDRVRPASQDNFPGRVRFSFAENSPGLRIRMFAPANFTLTISPKGSQA